MKSINSIVLYVKDLSLTKKFYMSHLGEDVKEISPTFFFQQFENINISFKQIDALKDINSESSVTGGGTELSFFFDKEEDFIFKKKKFNKYGVKVLGESQEIWGKTFFVEDPDGHRIRFNLAK